MSNGSEMSGRKVWRVVYVAMAAMSLIAGPLKAGILFGEASPDGLAVGFDGAVQFTAVAGDTGVSNLYLDLFDVYSVAPAYAPVSSGPSTMDVTVNSGTTIGGTARFIQGGVIGDLTKFTIVMELGSAITIAIGDVLTFTGSTLNTSNLLVLPDNIDRQVSAKLHGGLGKQTYYEAPVQVDTVPEPTSLLLVGVGSLLLGARRRYLS